MELFLFFLFLLLCIPKNDPQNFFETRVYRKKRFIWEEGYADPPTFTLGVYTSPSSIEN